MKTIFSILFLSLIVISCKKSESEVTSRFNESLKRFNEFKQQTGNNYSYTVTISSWTGFSSSTKITVLNGIVSSREYTAATRNDTSLVQLASWKETFVNLNSHQEGAQTLTLVQVYEKAKNEWLTANKKHNDIYFETKNNGMISLCGYVPDGCQDDCFFGIRISEIKAIDTE